MKFSEKLGEYIKRFDCSAKTLGEKSGLSGAAISRYRSGERVPETGSESFEALCAAIAEAGRKKGENLSADEVRKSFFDCDDISSTDKEQLRVNFNTLVSLLSLNISRLCKYTNYDPSTVFRIRNGSRRPADPLKFAADVADFVSKESADESSLEVLSKLFSCEKEELLSRSIRFEKVRDYLTSGNAKEEKNENGISGFLKKLNEFDLGEYIKAIRFDELKVPTLPFQLPTSKDYFGLSQMMESELDFLKAVVLSKSTAPVTMYSDMPISEMSKDPEFPKKWLFGMAMMLKKGLHLNMIHNVDRPFSEMMLGLEGYIPMYMTGQISPYYLKGVQNNVFLHLLKVGGTAALSGEAVAGFHAEGKYHLTKNKDEVAYYRKLSDSLLKNSFPLMDIYLKENENELNAFLTADVKTKGKRRGIFSSLPLYTASEDFLKRVLKDFSLFDEEKERIFNFFEFSKNSAAEILKNNVIEDEIPYLSKEEFEKYPMSLSLSGAFLEKDIPYTYESYKEHLSLCEKFAEEHENYILKKNGAGTFCNLQITLHEGKWAMVSKNKSPTIHFVIHHPKMREAIEHFVPPLVD